MPEININLRFNKLYKHQPLSTVCVQGIAVFSVGVVGGFSERHSPGNVRVLPAVLRCHQPRLYGP